MYEFLNSPSVAGAIGGIIALLISTAILKIKDFVKGTPTKLDDKIYKAIEDALKEKDSKDA